MAQNPISDDVVAWSTRRALAFPDATPIADVVMQIRSETLSEVERLLRRQGEIYMHAWLDRDVYDEYVPVEVSDQMLTLRERVAICDAHRRHVVGLMRVPPAEIAQPKEGASRDS